MKEFNERFKEFQGKLGNGVIDYSFVCSDGNNFIDVVSVDEDVYGIINILTDLKWWNIVKKYKLLKLLNVVYRSVRTAIVCHYDFDRLIYKLDKFQIKINPRDRIVVLDNIRYSMEVFDSMATFPIGVPFQFVSRKDGVVTLEKTLNTVGNN